MRFPPLFVVVALGLMLAQPARGQLSKPPTVVITPEPLTLKPGEALSPRALVQVPLPLIKNAASWSIEGRRHQGPVHSMAVSPDGELIATGGQDASVRIWEADTGKLIRCLLSHDYYVYALAWSPDGNTLASAGSHDATIRLWDRKTGMPLRRLKAKSYVTFLAWSPDGRQLAASGGTSGFTQAWDVLTSTPLFTADHGNPVAGTAFTRDGSRIVVPIPKANIAILDARSGRPADPGVIDLQNTTAATVAAGESDVWIGTTESIRRSTAGRLDAKPVVPLKSPTSLSVSSSGALAAAIPGATVAVIPGPDYDKSRSLKIPGYRVGWHPDGKQLFVLHGHEVIKWDTVTDKEVGRFAVGVPQARAIWLPSRPLLTGIGHKEPTLYSTATGKLLHKLVGHASVVTAAKFSPDGKQLATGSADKSVRIWDVSTGEVVRTLNGHQGTVTHLAYATDGRLASAGSDKTIRIWPTNSDEPQVLTNKDQKAITALTWATGRDNSMLACADTDNAIRVWSTSTGAVVQTVANPQVVRTLMFTAANKMLLVGSADQYLRIYQPITGQLLAEPELRIGSPSDALCLAMSADGSLLLTGRGNHTTQIVNWRVGKELLSVRMIHRPDSVVWGTDGKTFSAATLDGMIRFWDVAGALRATMLTGPNWFAAIGAAGHYRVSEEAEDELVYVVLTAAGMETLTPKQFTERFKRKNNPTMVRWTIN